MGKGALAPCPPFSIPAPWSARSSARAYARLDGFAHPTARASALILAPRGELFLEGRQFGERRIGIDRALAFARRRAACILPVRGAATGTAAVAIAFRLAGEFALVTAVAGLASIFALETLARRASFFLARFANRRCAFGGNGNTRRLGRGIAARFSKILVALAP